MRASSCVVIVIGMALLGCKSAKQPSPPRLGPPTFDEPAAEGDAPAQGVPPSASDPKAPREGCAPGGQVWDGKHEGCLYEVAGCCYPDATGACAAAGCEQDTCQILESAPAQITCRTAS